MQRIWIICLSMAKNEPNQKCFGQEPLALLVQEWTTEIKISKSKRSSNPRPKLPFNEIVKLKSEFDGTTEYAVFDKNWRKSYPNEYGVVTKWTPDFVQGVSYVMTGCGLLACPFGIIVGGGDLSSPLEIKAGTNTYSLYGSEGKFVLPSSFIKEIKCFS